MNGLQVAIIVLSRLSLLSLRHSQEYMLSHLTIKKSPIMKLHFHFCFQLSSLAI